MYLYNGNIKLDIRDFVFVNLFIFICGEFLRINDVSHYLDYQNYNFTVPFCIRLNPSYENVGPCKNGLDYGN